MSPEQLSGNPQRLDVRSDVYAIGVLIFEVLTGRLPHEIDDQAITTAAITLSTTRAARLSEFVPDLCGDLETITGKALEKEPARRYESAAALADDLRRYLAHQPIVARPPSMVYQARLFARRHRALVAGGTLAVAALLLATVISSVAAVHANRSAERESRQRQIAERTSMHLENMLMLPDPHERGASVTVAEMLELMVAQLDSEQELPEVEAEVREAIGQTYLNLRQHGEAVRQLERVVSLWRELDPTGEQLGESLAALGTACLNMGDNDASETAFVEAKEILEPYGGLEYEDVRFHLVELLMRQRRFEEARPGAYDLLALARQHNDAARVVARLRQVAKIESSLGEHDRAEQNLTEASALADEHLPEMQPVRVGIRNDLSMLRRTLGDHDGALKASSEAYEIAMRNCRPGSFDWNVCIHAHVQALVALDRRDEIISVLTDAQHALVETHGPDHRLVSETSRWLAQLQTHWQDPANAE